MNWTSKTSFTVPAGTYSIIDSDRETWSNNSESGFAGIARVRGYFLNNEEDLKKFEIAWHTDFAYVMHWSTHDVYTVYCGPHPHNSWVFDQVAGGPEFYSTRSNVCPAAVHAGKIKREKEWCCQISLRFD